MANNISLNNDIFLPVPYRLLTEILSNYNWVTIRRGCGVSGRTTKEKKLEKNGSCCYLNT